ncbi:hypothetical protein PPN31114_03483 [Pandoraea pneumonica]|uniref:Uncharacterized protein n=1 Tax=Pandoraea pneumonica TaxID=2508299 RepID=A0A5E4WVQ8_9BURK|nr:hypothetical protein [Pandoraea pneumonica]VVE27674.1 hypothetical protein PPN31114_03483 [Pandoraea pneumonica]
MHDAPNALTSIYWHDDTLRHRSVSRVVLWGHADIPAPPERLVTDWSRDISSHTPLAVGDVEPMPLARARMRWPEYSQCVQAAYDWTGAQGLPGLLAASDVALMACRGARYHHDGEQYGGFVFCNLFLSDDCGLDVHFPHAGNGGYRIPLTRGTMLVFDTCQPHAVIRRGSSGFDEADFANPVGTLDNVHMFLTWELPVDDARMVQALGIRFDVLSSAPAQDSQVLVDGRTATLCADTGRWLPVANSL